MTTAEITILAQAEATKLTDSELFWFGALGAVLALLVVQVLPFLLELLTHPTAPDIAPWKAVVALLIVGIFIAGGGVAALVAGSATEKGQALSYGLAWQASIGGAIQGARAALK